MHTIHNRKRGGPIVNRITEWLAFPSLRPGAPDDEDIIDVEASPAAPTIKTMGTIPALAQRVRKLEGRNGSLKKQNERQQEQLRELSARVRTLESAYVSANSAQPAQRLDRKH